MVPDCCPDGKDRESLCKKCLRKRMKESICRDKRTNSEGGQLSAGNRRSILVRKEEEDLEGAAQRATDLAEDTSKSSMSVSTAEYMRA